MNLCPSCRDGDVAKAGSGYKCLDCGRPLRSKPEKAEAPSARQLTIHPSEDGSRFHGRAAFGTIVVPLGFLGAVGVVEAVLALATRPSSPALIALFVAVPVVIALWLVLVLIRASEVLVTRAGVTIRTSPFAGRAAGTYARDDIAHFGWIRVQGAELSYSYVLWMELRDGRRVRIPFDVIGEGQSVYVARKLRKAFEAAA